MKALGPIALATAIGCAAGGASGTVSPSTGAGTTSGGTPCASLPVVFDSLTPGVYWIEAQGLVGDAQAYVLYGSDLTVGPGATSAYSVLLPPVTP